MPIIGVTRPLYGSRCHSGLGRSFARDGGGFWGVGSICEIGVIRANP